MGGCPCNNANNNENNIIGGSSCKKGGFNYRSKSKSKSKSKTKSKKTKGGINITNMYPLNKDPTVIGRPIKGGSLIGNTIGSPFSNTGNTGALGSYNTLNAQSGGTTSDVTNQTLKNNSPMV